ncbi:MAG: MarR family transcriptional regulator [Cellulosilyticaceae bacterium]
MEINKEEPISRYISQIHRKGGSVITKELSQYGVGVGQLMFLIELYREDGIHQEVLCEKLHIDKGTTARAVKKLEEEQFIVRVKDNQDKRAYKIYLTDKSRVLKESIFCVLEEWNKTISNELTEEEKLFLINILRRICTTIGG